MVHINGDRTQPCLTPDLIWNQLLTSYPALTGAVLFSYIAQITLVYFSGIPYNDKTFVNALLSTESIQQNRKVVVVVVVTTSFIF